jgi:trans-aconitate methyltransferase
MLKRGHELPGGDSSKIRWLLGSAETIDLEAPYALIVAGESLHWMNWQVVLPRFASLLTPRGMLAVVQEVELDNPWHEDYIQLVKRFSNNPTYQPIDLIVTLIQHNLFQEVGETQTAPQPQPQSIVDYIAAQHARSALSLETMTSEQATQFDAELHTLLLPHSDNGEIMMQIVGHVVWGKPIGSQEQIA